MVIAFARTAIIGRSSGRSVVACAAYRHGKSLDDERQDKTHDYSRRGGVLAEGVALPDGAPEWMRDLGALTNAVERREDRNNKPHLAQLMREVVIALPHELTVEENTWLVKNIVKEAATRKGMVAAWAVHEPSGKGDDRNIHAHVLLTMRSLDENDPDGFGGKNRVWDRREEQEKFKGIIERETNKMLERCGHEVRMSFEEGKSREGGIHLGHAASALERKGIETEAGNANREIAARNAEREMLDTELQQIKEQLERLYQQDGQEPGKEADAGERQRQRQDASISIREAWGAAERDPVQFVIALGERGLTLAENDKGRFVAVDDRGAVHSLSAAALGEKPWQVQDDLAAAFRHSDGLAMPSVAEVRQDLREKRQEEREAERLAKAAERAALWEERQAAWKEQRQLDRQIERIEAAQERGQSRGAAKICRAYAESTTGAEFVEELEARGFMVARVSAEDAHRSAVQRAVLGNTPRYEEGDLLAVTERGHAYRINAETIGLTEATLYDHQQTVKERLAQIAPDSVLSYGAVQEIVTDITNDRGRISTNLIEDMPSAWEVGGVVETAIDVGEAVASKGLGVVTQAGSAIFLGVENLFFGGASRKAPGGAEYIPPSAAAKPAPAPGLDHTKDKQERLRTTSGVEAVQDQAANEKVAEKQGEGYGEQWEELRRERERQERERRLREQEIERER